MRILGFSAHKQGGKTTAVKALISALPTYGPYAPLVVSFAGPLKDIVRRCFVPVSSPLVMSSFDTEEDKEAVLPCGKTVRQMLQIVGTDWFRTAWPDVWINAFKSAVAVSTSQNIIVPDVRFPNELRAIHDMGGHVIRFLRSPFPDSHPSETALDDVGFAEYGFDAIIDNRNMDIDEQTDRTLYIVRVNRWLNTTSHGLPWPKEMDVDGSVHDVDPRDL